MSFSYSGDPSASDLNAVRFEIADTNAQAPLLQDAEVEWAILSETGVAAGTPASVSGATLYASAARCCEAISQSFLATADTQVGQLKITSTTRAAQYLARAKELRLRAQGFYAPYSGGLSISEKIANAEDADLVQPAFTRHEFENPWTGPQTGFESANLGPPFR